jgi:ATP-dependent DNA ligase
LPSFSQTQAASDGQRGVRLLYYAFDLLHLDGRDTAILPLVERKVLLEPLIADAPGVQFNAHETGDGEIVRQHACKLGFEGVVSKTIDAPYAPGNRGLWRKSKCLNRQEFVVVGWTDPEGSRPYLGALLLGYYTWNQGLSGARLSFRAEPLEIDRNLSAVGVEQRIDGSTLAANSQAAARRKGTRGDARR